MSVCHAEDEQTKHCRYYRTHFESEQPSQLEGTEESERDVDEPVKELGLVNIGHVNGR